VTIELLLQISMATLTALGTLLLGMGEREMTLPLIAIVVSASSVYLTDVSGWLRLNPRVANIAGSTAIVIFVWDFLQRFGSETQLLAVANLLIYLQFVLLYQRKTNSTYWLLALLSLLQVAVATALNFELLFGLLLLVYLLCGLTALGLFFLHREMRECRQIAPAPIASIAAPADNARWPLALRGPAIRTAWEPAFAGNAIGWRFLRQISGLAATTLVIALGFFFVVPRVHQNNWRMPTGQPQNVVGASNEVRLGELGPIMENPEVVMRIELYRGASNQPYTLKQAPLFRGPILSQYTRGAWRQAGDSTHSALAPGMGAVSAQLVRQVIHLRPLNVSSVYCVAPLAGVVDPSGNRLQFNALTQQLTRSEPHRDQTLEVYTPGFADGRQTSLLPSSRLLEPSVRRELTEIPADGLDEMATLAEALTAGIDPQDAMGRARALTNHLHDSGLYSYSLSPPKRDPSKDPIDDFLFVHQVGHCEYFASALALMLRSVDIPSRMVIGFNGGEYLFGFYQVRQLHAHAWVEAYLRPDQLPDKLRGQRAWRFGAWVTLDPTPGTGGAISRIGAASGVPSFRQFIDYARYLWSSYIMGMDSDRQLRTIYEPLALWIIQTTRDLFDPAWWRAALNRWLLAIGIDNPRAGPWFLFGALVLLGLALALRAWRWPLRMFGKLWSALARRGLLGSRGEQTVVEFYRRLEQTLAPWGLVRPVSSTQEEFAAVAAERLAQWGLPPDAALAPVRVTDAFYVVRFGRQQLDKQRAQAVEQALDALAAIHPHTARPSRR